MERPSYRLVILRQMGWMEIKFEITVLPVSLFLRGSVTTSVRSSLSLVTEVAAMWGRPGWAAEANLIQHGANIQATREGGIWG